MKECVFKWIRQDNLMIACNTQGPVGPETWKKFLDDLRTQPFTKYLGCSIGTLEVSPVQRQEASNLLRARGTSMSIVTDDALVRGIVTAASWLGVNIKSFPWKEIQKALERLAVPAEQMGVVVSAVERLRDECLREATQKRP